MTRRSSTEHRAPFMRALGCLIVPFLLACSTAIGQEDSSSIIDRIKWVAGPARVAIGDVADLDLPSGYGFADAEGAALLAQATDNLPDPSQLGVIVAPDGSWFITLTYSAEGYVKDTEGASFDKAACDAMLAEIQKNNDAANQEKRRRGIPALFVRGWEQLPAYDPVTHRLAWAIQVSGEGSDLTANYRSRLLSRDGVLATNMVVSADQMRALIPTYRMLTSAVTFRPGRTYAEFRPGDKVAEYGLTALVTGGTAVVALKWWKPLLKFGAIIVIALGALATKLKGWFGGKQVVTAGPSTTAQPQSSNADVPTEAWATIHCPACGQANRVRSSGDGQPMCGKCRAPMST